MDAESRAKIKSLENERQEAYRTWIIEMEFYDSVALEKKKESYDKFAAKTDQIEQEIIKILHKARTEA